MYDLHVDDGVQHDIDGGEESGNLGAVIHVECWDLVSKKFRNPSDDVNDEPTKPISSGIESDPNYLGDQQVVNTMMITTSILINFLRLSVILVVLSCWMMVFWLVWHSWMSSCSWLSLLVGSSVMFKLRKVLISIEIFSLSPHLNNCRSI